MASLGGISNTKFLAKKAYEFNSLIQLQRSVRVQDSSGKAVYTWITVDSVWADVMPLTGMKLYYANQLAPELSIEVSLRFRPDMQAGMRFLDGANTYLIKRAPINLDGRNVYLRCVCEQQQVGVIS